MKLTPEILPQLITAIVEIIKDNFDAVTALDQAIGDGDHVINLQRGLNALEKQATTLTSLSWDMALEQTGMIVLGTMGGASGSLFGKLFITMGQTAKGQDLNLKTFATVFTEGVKAVKKLGKADVGEKTMLDVLVPVEKALQQTIVDSTPFDKMLGIVCKTAIAGVEATRNMVASKGRASFMGERTQGHIDAGAKTSQLMICAITEVLQKIDNKC